MGLWRAGRPSLRDGSGRWLDRRAHELHLGQGRQVVPGAPEGVLDPAVALRLPEVQVAVVETVQAQEVVELLLGELSRDRVGDRVADEHHLVLLLVPDLLEVPGLGRHPEVASVFDQEVGVEEVLAGQVFQARVVRAPGGPGGGALGCRALHLLVGDLEVLAGAEDSLLVHDEPAVAVVIAEPRDLLLLLHVLIHQAPVAQAPAVEEPRHFAPDRVPLPTDLGREPDVDVRGPAVEPAVAAVAPGREDDVEVVERGIAELLPHDAALAAFVGAVAELPVSGAPPLDDRAGEVVRGHASSPFRLNSCAPPFWLVLV